ncbi:MAG: transcription termination factor Rho [Lachnospiraceae bacterium]
MRDKLQSLPMTELREIAKANGIKSVTAMRKAALIDKIIEVTGSEASSTPNATYSSQPQVSPVAVSETPVSIPGYTMTTVHEQPARPQGYVPQEMQRSTPYSNPAYTSTYEPKQRPYSSYDNRPQRNSYDRSSSYDRNSNNSGYDRNSNNSYDRNSNNNNYDRSSGSYDRTSGSNYDRNDRNTSYVRTHERTTGYDRNQTDRSSTYDRTSPDRNYRDTRSYDNQSYERPSYDRQTYDRSNYERPANNNFERSFERTINDDIAFDPALDSGIDANGILEVMPDGFGFIRCENYMPGDNDVYVSPIQIRKFNLKTGDVILGKLKVKTPSEKFAALLYITTVNGYSIPEVLSRKSFENLTPVFPDERIRMETDNHNTAMRILDIVSPIGKGQRGLIVSQPKAGKTTLLKEIAHAIAKNNPEMHMIILLIDERPEEVTDIKEAIAGKNVEVIYSTFDELPEHHKRVSEMVIERGKRLVEHGKDVVILLDSITRLARAYNLIVPPSGRTLSGGLDPAALHAPKKFFGAARNMRESGSLTILATALVETGSKMDDVVFEEFKGTGNMELVLDRKLSEKRVFPAIDILKSGTRRDDLLLSEEEAAAADIIKKVSSSLKPDDAVETILNLFAKTKDNAEFCQTIVKQNL